MNQEQVQVLMKKADYFYKNSIPVHIKFKENYWKRGLITELSSDFFLLDERMEGKMPIFFLEIEDIREFKEREK